MCVYVCTEGKSIEEIRNGCVCVCVHIFDLVYVYACACVCVCACVCACMCAQVAHQLDLLWLHVPSDLSGGHLQVVCVSERVCA